jgi:murein DD-endopeptidase MepM/ murein hydrolase activator NlpD
MKRLLFLFLLVVQGACSGINQATPTEEKVEGQTSNVGSITPVESQTSKVIAPSNTVTPQPPTVTFTESPAQTETPTPVICDPAASYCIEDGHFVLDRPIAPPGTVRIDSGYPYGSTEGGTRDPHHGVEFYNASGTPVLAAAPGIVVVAGDDSQNNYALLPDTYGNLIILEHHFEGIVQPVYTLYAHLSRVEVQVGQTARQGDEIGQVGATGIATGSHLHFEVRLGKNNYDSNRNPVLWLKPLADEAGIGLGVLAGRVEDSQGNLLETDALNIQYFARPGGPQSAAWQVNSYAPEEHPVRRDNALNETFAMGDLPAGDYRISLIQNGRLYERQIQVEPGRLTFFVLRIDS